MQQNSEAQSLADGGSGHVNVQSEKSAEHFCANRAHYDGYFENEASAPDEELYRTRHVALSTPLANDLRLEA